MRVPDVPKGCVLKATEGTWFQVFNSLGECIEQKFIAGDQCDYTDSDGESLASDDKRLNFYKPFEILLSPDQFLED